MKQRVLLIDDSFYMRTLLKNILSDAGYTIVGEASDGETALRMAADTQPDLITLDLILPDMNGLDILRQLQQTQSATKVIIVSAVGQDGIVQEALSIGANAYVIKPFSEEKVLETVNSVLSMVS